MAKLDSGMVTAADALTNVLSSLDTAIARLAENDVEELTDQSILNRAEVRCNMRAARVRTEQHLGE